jgi:hypothetical protein
MFDRFARTDNSDKFISISVRHHQQPGLNGYANCDVTFLIIGVFVIRQNVTRLT